MRVCNEYLEHFKDELFFGKNQMNRVTKKVIELELFLNQIIGTM